MSVALLPGNPPTIVTLDERRTVRWSDPSGSLISRAQAPTYAWRLIPDPPSGRGVGVSPPEVVARAVGDFFGDGRRAVAVATGSGQLAILDLAGGEVRVRLEWDRVADLLAHDVDGDGRDELIVASARALVTVDLGPTG
jgi:hypothetical protein